MVCEELKNNDVHYKQALVWQIGKFKGEVPRISRIPIIPTYFPFQFKRIQLAFAVTINKSQGQSLEVCGINLEFSCFSHSLYVASSRVGKPFSLFINCLSYCTQLISVSIQINQ
ncbi:P-loop containing nucleoside triphosphate hydrolase [Cinara cedri]|uniref:P-loop containing nucleoside triphosphate hydrolase n=1 Tax=Cinara cedri TaxID=506608 RepID=A0A5E4MC44_9HEMI|nr:P-loop containing nucleoside triphosphate hydrolase [Cinara cedri]